MMLNSDSEVAWNLRMLAFDLIFKKLSKRFHSNDKALINSFIFFKKISSMEELSEYSDCKLLIVAIALQCKMDILD